MRSASALALVAALATPFLAGAQATPSRAMDTSAATLLVPARVFDGTDMHEGWSVLVRGERIVGAGSAATLGAPAGTTRIDLPGTTLMPGMIEMHSHLLLHPYNETPWDDQVLHEPLALRIARAGHQRGDVARPRARVRRHRHARGMVGARAR